MRAKEWAKASNPLVPLLEGFRPMNRGYVRCHEWVAECLFADSSAFSKMAFYVNAFPFPLFVPSERVYFNYGFRVGGRWEAVDADLYAALEAALPKLRSLATLEGLLARARRPDANVRHAELHLCIAILRNDGTEVSIAQARFDGWVPEVDWVEPVVARNLDLLALVASDGMAAGMAELERRREQTIRALD